MHPGTEGADTAVERRGGSFHLRNAAQVHGTIERRVVRERARVFYADCAALRSKWGVVKNQTLGSKKRALD